MVSSTNRKWETSAYSLHTLAIREEPFFFFLNKGRTDYLSTYNKNTFKGNQIAQHLFPLCR